MNAFQKKITLRVLGIHAAIVVLMFLVSVVPSCFKKKDKDIVTFIEFGEAAPAVSVQQVANMTEPEPTPPEPEPEPAPIPEPVKKKPEPIKKKPEPIKKKPEPVKSKPPKPKWKPTKVDPTKSKVIKATPTKPTVTNRDISEALNNIQKTSNNTGPAGNPDAISAYDSHIYSVFYNAWSQPGTPGSRPAEVTISIQSNGRIKTRTLTRSSGDTQFDATVMVAVRSISIFPRKPPTGYPLDNIVVQFRIVN
jgi:TonB family protein